VDEFIARQAERNVKLTHDHCLAVENALKEYERLCFLVGVGEGAQLPPKLRTLEGAAADLVGAIKDVQNEEGYIWEHLSSEAEFPLNNLERLLEECEKVNREVLRRSRAQTKAFLLNRLLSKLAEIYTAATGKRATISKASATKRDPFPGGKGGPFLSFARAALSYLPAEFRPAEKTLRGLGSRFERQTSKEEAGRVIPINWVGLPYPPLARPNWKASAFRRLTGKRP
jgi:hypothetical protein